jgi:hypothetical protein
MLIIQVLGYFHFFLGGTSRLQPLSAVDEAVTRHGHSHKQDLGLFPAPAANHQHWFSATGKPFFFPGSQAGGGVFSHHRHPWMTVTVTQPTCTLPLLPAAPLAAAPCHDGAVA